MNALQEGPRQELMEHAEIPLNMSAGAASKSVPEDAPADRDLVEQCQRGQMEAYEILVGRYRQRVYGLAFSMLRNEQDATDLSQETFVKAWRAIGGFKKNSSFYTWLYRITTNLCIDFVRKRDRRPTVPLEDTVEPDVSASVEIAPSNQSLPTDELRRKELRAQIDAAMEELSPEHRVVLQLREIEGLDYAEIAKVVGCQLGTVMSRLHYARKHMQKLLKDVI